MKLDGKSQLARREICDLAYREHIWHGVLLGVSYPSTSQCCTMSEVLVDGLRGDETRVFGCSFIISHLVDAAALALRLAQPPRNLS